MYIISRRIVNSAIEDFVKKKFKNKDGIQIETVLEKDEEFVTQFLNRYYKAFSTLIKNKKLVSEIFVERLKRIDVIRFDQTDKNVYPVKFAFDEMEDACEGKLEGGLFMPIMNHGVILLDMDYNNLSKAEALHTLIHELTHAMILTEKLDSENKIVYKNGISEKGRVFYRLNEGITEYISQILWAKMYSGKRCPGDGRYRIEVEAAKMIIQQIGAENLFIEDYIINSERIENQMNILVDQQGKTLSEFLMSFNKKDFRRVDVQKKFMREINQFKYFSDEKIL